MHERRQRVGKSFYTNLKFQNISAARRHLKVSAKAETLNQEEHKKFYCNVYFNVRETVCHQVEEVILFSGRGKNCALPWKRRLQRKCRRKNFPFCENEFVLSVTERIFSVKFCKYGDNELLNRCINNNFINAKVTNCNGEPENRKEEINFESIKGDTGHKRWCLCSNLCAAEAEDDHNRILNPTITAAGNNKPISKPESSAATTSEHQENDDGNVVLGINNNNNVSEKSTNASIRTNSRTSSPTVLTNATTTIITNKKTPASPVLTATNTNDKKHQLKLQNSSATATASSGRKLLSQKQHQQLSEDAVSNNSALELNDELQQLKCLNRYSFNGPLNYKTFEQQQRQLEELQKQAEHQTKSTEALGVLLQYLVYDVRNAH